jgi:hypothetical protein
MSAVASVGEETSRAKAHDKEGRDVQWTVDWQDPDSE